MSIKNLCVALSLTLVFCNNLTACSLAKDTMINTRLNEMN